MASFPSPEEYPSTPLVILLVDLAGYAALFRTHSDADMACFLHRYYTVGDQVISDQGGRVVKFIGDSILAVFPQTHAPHAVAAAVTLEVVVARIANKVGLSVTVGANVHMGPAVEAELGRGASRRPDIVGRAVNQTFLLGRGPGIRISEPVYRKLPSAERTPWDKNKPPAVYALGERGEPYAGLRKTAGENALRW